MEYLNLIKNKWIENIFEEEVKKMKGNTEEYIEAMRYTEGIIPSFLSQKCYLLIVQTE